MQGLVGNTARIAGALLLCLTTAALAQEKPANNDWPMESLRLKDGRVLKGLMQSRREGEIEFIEIVRPPGRPMYGVLYPLAPKEVDSFTPLEEQDRVALARRFAQFRYRAVIETGRMEALTLKRIERDRQAWWVYQGGWFSLESTADEATTRRSIVRIEQTFRAYRLILAPRTTELRNLRIVLHGSMDDYRTYLAALGLDIANPAYYSIAQNEIVAGSDLSQYALELAKAEAQSESTRKEFVALDRQLPAKLKSLAEQMQRNGFTPDEIKDELQTRRAAWASEMQQMERQHAEIRRRNEAKFIQVTDEMFRRLRHEAFHAYVENYVFPHEQGELPRWLNEGLAQIFEHAQLEGDALRVDAPNADLLDRLQNDLRGDNPLPLARLLTAEGRAFVKTHGSERIDRNYLYAWGLAWYLTFEFDLLHSERLEKYTETGEQGRIKRFEELTKRPLSKLEPAWRDAMLKLRGR